MGLTSLTSCEDIYEGGDKDLPDVPVQIKPQVSPYGQEKAEALGADVKIGVYMISSETGLPLAANLEMTTDEDGLVDAGESLTYPKDGSKVNIICYTPYTPTASDNNLLTLDVSTAAAAEMSDYLYSANRNKYMALSPVKVQMRHILSLAEFYLTLGEGISEEDLKDLTLAFDGIPVKADFDILSDEIASKAEGRIPIALDINSKYGKCQVIPGGVSNLTVACTFKGLSFSKKLGSMDFQSGKLYKFDLVVSEPGFEIVLRQIEDWEVVEY